MLSIKTVQTITMSTEDFIKLMREAVKQELDAYKFFLAAKKDDNILTRKEAAKELKIDLSTLHIWTEKGALIPYRPNAKGRVYYKRDENTILNK